MGGFLGSVEEWERASDAWDACLHATPSIEYFKDSERKSLDGQFVKFNRATADAKVLALATTISQFALLGFCATVSYTWFMHRDAKASRGYVGARVYDWGFLTATSGVLQHLDSKHPGSDLVDFIFDSRTELRACIEIYDRMKADRFSRTWPALVSAYRATINSLLLYRWLIYLPESVVTIWTQRSAAMLSLPSETTTELSMFRACLRLNFQTHSNCKRLAMPYRKKLLNICAEQERIRSTDLSRRKKLRIT
jgi:hypothetical protein